MTNRFFFTCALLLVSVALSAQTFTKGGFTYKVTGKGTVEVSAAETSMSGNWAIAQTVPYADSSFKVTSIAENGFANCSGLNNLVIPNSVSKIGKNAFLNCYSLNAINIPYSVKKIPQGAFCHCRSLTGITVPDGVVEIGAYAFAHCSSLMRFIVPDACKSIGDKAFYNCKNMSVVELSGSVENLGVRVLQGCTGLRRLSVLPENPKFVSVDDVLFTKDMQCLIKYPAHKDLAVYDMPQGVKTIAEFAFEDVKKLVGVNISRTCTRISCMAFINCENLQTAPYPPSLREVGMDSFFGCNVFKEGSLPGSVNYIEFNFAEGIIEELE
ncbi:MAG: leucine-rich repeat domain-containing protein [Bacteroidales bacterium]|nr:leucine-rich repeat domain-containing protein [Bacteroidales bacterium]